VVHLNYEN